MMKGVIERPGAEPTASTASGGGDPEMERRAMSLAEREQCGLDNFWGLVANQAEQAEATAAMEMEDVRSEAVRAGIKKEEKFALWEQEDLRMRETKGVVKGNLEEAARIEYLKIFYSESSADFSINYRWPTCASLQHTLEQRQPDAEVDDSTTLTVTFSRDGSSYVSAHKSGGYSRTEQPISTTHSLAAVSSNSTTTGGSSSTRPFHSFRGKKAHQIIPIRDCFVAPRHIPETTTRHGNISMDVASPCVSSHGDVRPSTTPATAGLTRAVHLPPMAETIREDRRMPFEDPNTITGGGKCRWVKNKQLLTPKPGAPGESLMPSFQRKFDVKHEVWTREAEEHAEERIFEEQIRAEEIIREINGLYGGGGTGGGGDCGCGGSGGGGGGARDAYRPKGNGMFDSAIVEGGRRELGGERRPRRTRRRGWRDDDYCDQETVAELIPEREQELLTQMFHMLDARDRGEVQLDEVLFHMTENAQVKTVLKQVSLWIMTKTRRWEWAEELIDAQPGRTLTLPSLLEFCRGFHQQNGMRRDHLRLARARRESDAARRDFRSRRLLPADLKEGQEVEALFLKGFEWYRAWIVKCHENDTFDVRFTRPLTPSEDESESPRGGEVEKVEEWRPNVETPLRDSGSEEYWGSDGESCTTAVAEEQWRATCDRVAQFIGIPPDLGETEPELLEKAFDTVYRLAKTKTGTPLGSGNKEFQLFEEACSSGGGNGTVIGDGNRGTTKQPGGAIRQQEFWSITPAGGGGCGGGDDGCGGGSGGVGGGGRVSVGVGGDRGGGNIDAPRVLASEITRLLLAGDLDEYRQASPALSAACVYQDFARGLEDVAKERHGRSSTSNADCRNGDYSGVGKARGDGDDVCAGERGWVSKEEFCDYFEAVTDLVELNGLSLTQPACRQSSTTALKA